MVNYWRPTSNAGHQARRPQRVRVARRPAYNRHLGEAVTQWAFCSLTQSAWARDFYDAKIAVDKEPPSGAARPRQPLARSPLALRAYRRGAGVDPERLSGLQRVAQALAGDRTGAAD